MPATYEDFKKQFEAVKGAVLKFAGEIDKNERFMGQTTGVIQEGVKEVGLRVQDLKDNGMKGSTIDAFMADPEIKTMVGSIRQYLAMMQKELLKAAAAVTDIKKMVAGFQKLKVDVTNEIAARKKQLTTKVGTGNKSISDMEALLAEMKKYTDQAPFAKVEVFESEKYDEHLQETNAALTKEVTQAKDLALNAFQKQMQQQALNPRVLNGNVNSIRTAYTLLMKACADGLKAAAAKDAKTLATARGAIVKPWKDLQDMNHMYQDALKDTWISSKIKDSKDKSAIDSGIKMIADMKAKAAIEVTKLASAKV